VPATLAIATEDFRLYHDLVAALRERGLPFRTLHPGGRVPPGTGAVLTSPGEAGAVRFSRVIPCGDLEDAIARAIQLSRGRASWRELVVGVDPGPRPGVAAMGDGEILDRRTARDPEDVARVVRDAVRNFPAGYVRVRVGHGDPTNRNRILNALAADGRHVEIVDERSTTRRTHTRDLDAAVAIARARGVRADGTYPVEPTAGELREIQRRSRIGSGGNVTIPKRLAREVALGRLTLAEAVERHRRR
jgi:hypothetical protein